MPEPSGTNPPPRDAIERFAIDDAALKRALPPAPSPLRAARLRRFLDEQSAQTDAWDFDSLGRSEQIDCLLLQNHLRYEQRRLDLAHAKQNEIAFLLPFAGAICEREEARIVRRESPVSGEDAAGFLDQLAKAANGLKKQFDGDKGGVRPLDAQRASEALQTLQNTLESWFGFHDGYDPLFSWWTRDPYQTAKKALTEYQTFLRETLAGIKADDSDKILGDPIGEEAILNELAHEGIAATPDELIAMGDREAAWCEQELIKASRELGCGDHWREAIEKVKERHVPPGEQPRMVRELAEEAIAFVDARGLVTVPPLARETWRMSMISPERQKTSPFFLGGEVIQISYPTDAMPHERKRMSLRGNNRHFSRATVQHELIPGHHLQLFQAARYNTHRRPFATPFYIEGWTLHWEMLLWELNFPQTPEDRIGMLFWRMHRCARITFSLNFHLGRLTPEQCVDLLVERVGHERENAVAEVRRSCGDAYPPLYQCAYLLGGLQMHRLYRDQVESGKQTPRAFHDAVLHENAIPLSLLRAALDDSVPLLRNTLPSWRFD